MRFHCLTLGEVRKEEEAPPLSLQHHNITSWKPTQSLALLTVIPLQRQNFTFHVDALKWLFFGLLWRNEIIYWRSSVGKCVIYTVVELSACISFHQTSCFNCKAAFFFVEGNKVSVCLSYGRVLCRRLCWFCVGTFIQAGHLALKRAVLNSE